MITNYLKTAWRNLLRHKQFTFLNLLGLSTGLASAILIFLWVNGEMHVDRFNEKDSRLYKVLFNIPMENTVLTLQSTPSPLAPALVKEMPEVEHAVTLNHFIDWFAGEGVATVGDNHIKAKGMFASKDLFDVFSYKLLQGNKDVALEDKNGVVISEKLARRLFNTTANLVGKPLQWDHRMKFKDPLHISGVVADPPASSTIKFDIVFNYDLMLENDKNSEGWRSTYADTYLILRNGTDPAQLEKKIAGFAGIKDPVNKNNSLFLQRFSTLYLHDQYENGKQVGGRIQYVRLFSMVALFILIIACINFMNLSTAQASRKMKEIGVKKAIGASRKSIMFQFIAESIFMAFLAVVIAIMLIVVLLPQFNQITGKQLALNFQPTHLFSISAIALFTGLMSGCYPAFYLSGFNPVTVLKGKLSTSFAEVWIRKGLVVFQFTLSVVFIIGFIVINKQVAFVQTKNLGYNRDNIITFKREGKLNGDPEVFLSALKDIPGVIKVGAMAGTILDPRENQSGFSWRGQDADMDYIFKSPRISYDAIETFGLKVLAGRSFSRDFKEDDSKIILNESAVKKMELDNAIGKIIKTGNSESEIIGVVNDFQLGSVHHIIEPLVFRFRPAGVATNVLVKIKPGTEQSVIKRLEQYYKKFHPNYPFEFSFFDSDYRALYAAEERVASLSRYFAGLAIIISCLGLFGLATFTAQKRQKEIGIRKVIGATVSNIVLMLSKDFLRLVGIALLIALPLGWWAMKEWLQSFAYRTEIGLTVFAVAGFSILFITMLTVSFQAIKAAIANPVKSLRTE
jgi:ABC-type antimicrobial peptide transport system permease subunit